MATYWEYKNFDAAVTRMGLTVVKEYCNGGYRMKLCPADDRYPGFSRDAPLISGTFDEVEQQLIGFEKAFYVLGVHGVDFSKVEKKTKESQKKAIDIAEKRKIVKILGSSSKEEIAQVQKEKIDIGLRG